MDTQSKIDTLKGILKLLTKPETKKEDIRKIKEPRKESGELNQDETTAQSLDENLYNTNELNNKDKEDIQDIPDTSEEGNSKIVHENEKPSNTKISEVADGIKMLSQESDEGVIHVHEDNNADIDAGAYVNKAEDSGGGQIVAKDVTTSVVASADSSVASEIGNIAVGGAIQVLQSGDRENPVVNDV